MVNNGIGPLSSFLKEMGAFLGLCLLRTSTSSYVFQLGLAVTEESLLNALYEPCHTSNRPIPPLHPLLLVVDLSYFLLSPSVIMQLI